jgi:hypothetical protein
VAAGEHGTIAERSENGVVVRSSRAEIELTGRVIAYDRAGNVLDTEGGHFRCTAQGTHGTSKGIAVVNGRWTLTAALGDVLSLEDLVLAKQRARFREASLVVSSAAAQVLEADLEYLGRLRVVDALSGLDLDRLSVILAADFVAAERRHPPLAVASRPLLSGGSSPLEMPDNPGVNVYWVCAPGYAWGRIAFSGEGGERTLALDSAAALEIHASRVRFDAGEHVVRVRELEAPDGNATGEVVCDVDLVSDEAVVLSNLWPAELEAQVLLRPPGGPARILATQRVDLRPGESRRADLDVAAGYEQATGSLHGQLILPPGSSGPATQLSIVRADGSAADSDGDFVLSRRAMQSIGEDAVVWSVGGLRPGAYRVGLEPYGACVDAVVVGGEDREVRLDSTESATVHLWITSVEGALVSTAKVSWRHRGLRSGGPWGRASIAGPGEPYVLIAAPGTLRLNCRGEGFRTLGLDVEVIAGPNDLALVLQPGERHEIELELRDGDAEVTVPPAFWSGVVINGSPWPDELLERDLTGTGDGSGRSVDVASATLALDRAGSYLLEFPPIEGYDPIPPLRVELTDAELHVTRRLMLARRR